MSPQFGVVSRQIKPHKKEEEKGATWTLHTKAKPSSFGGYGFVSVQYLWEQRLLLAE